MEGLPVSILAINRSTDSNHELAALALFRRNCYVFQSAYDASELISEAFNEGLTSTTPVIWNILLPNNREPSGKLMMEVASESRFFPRLTYQPESGASFGSHFNLNNNTSPELSFPQCNFSVKQDHVVAPHEFPMSMADYWLMDPSRRKEIEIIPEQFETDDLLPITQYLEQTPATTAGKIPFVWVADKNLRLYKAAVPLKWTEDFRKRLEYWKFLQELAGTRNSHVTQAIDNSKSEWEQHKQAEIDELKSTLKSEADQTRDEEMRLGITRMLYALMDPDLDVEKALKEAAKSPTPISTPPQPTSTPEVPVADVGQSITAVESSEVWIESDECTSCNDCIDLLPAVFKYNSDKQAIVHNPTGGTFAKIVAAAEKCPARCIHPGQPYNKDEKGLEKLLKRAEKYN